MDKNFTDKPLVQGSFLSENFFFICLCILLIVLLTLGKPQAATGDEPRYLMYAASFIHSGHYVMSLPDWQAFSMTINGVRSDALPSGAGGVVLLNGAYLPTLLSPVALISPLFGLRFVTLIVGLVGLYHLIQLCRRASDGRSARIAVALSALSIPFLPYLNLFYMETYLFTLVCVSWERLQRPERALYGDLFTAFLILALPFVHMRGSIVAVALYAILLLQMYRRGLIQRAIAFIALAAIALALLVVLNLSIYGAVTGPVNTARPPALTELFNVLAMQLFNVRHGLFAYAPVWLLGYVGLWIAVLKKSRVGVQALVLATIAAVTGVGVNPGECWPARFWVMSIPMLTVGLSIWLPFAKGYVTRIIAVGLVLFTLINTALFFGNPNSFLENRQTTTTYDKLFDRIGHANPGLSLPVELGDPANMHLARNMALAAAVIMLLLLIAAIRNKDYIALPALLLLVLALDMTRVMQLPPRSYSVSTNAQQIVITFNEPIQNADIQFGQLWATWYSAPAYPLFNVNTRSEGLTHSISMPANQVVRLRCHGPISSVTISTAPGVDLAQEASVGISVYKSRSLVDRLVSKDLKNCS